MQNDYSFTALMEFLDFLGNKGLMKKNTVFSRKAACNKMLSILEADERVDLRNLDLDQVSDRFNNLEGKAYAPKSLRVYKSRVNNALSDFFRYTENPANFKMSIKPKPHAKVQLLQEVTSSTPQEVVAKPEHIQNIPHKVNTINVPIAISADCIIQVNGIPVNMTHSEAKKIANVILAMAPAEE